MHCHVQRLAGCELGLLLLELLEGSQHICSGYRLRLSGGLHQFLCQLFYKLLSGVHLAVKKKRQDVADCKSLHEGYGQVLVLALSLIHI